MEGDDKPLLFADIMARKNGKRSRSPVMQNVREALLQLSGYHSKIHAHKEFRSSTNMQTELSSCCLHANMFYVYNRAQTWVYGQ